MHAQLTLPCCTTPSLLPHPRPSSPSQRFAQTNAIKRTILELIAAELVKMMPPALSGHGMQGYQQ